jgi:prepilin signal peptidase PulO-like enzyme (type II secretory pathway)
MIHFFVMNQFPGDPFFWIFVIFSIPISIIDLRSRRIPDLLSIPCFVLLLLARLLLTPRILPGCLAAAVFGVILFYCVRTVTKGLGLGDVKFAAIIGLFCGFPRFLPAFLIADLVGIAVTLLLFLPTGVRPRSLPFAPFLSAGALIAYEIWGY